MKHIRLGNFTLKSIRQPVLGFPYYMFHEFRIIRR